MLSKPCIWEANRVKMARIQTLKSEFESLSMRDSKDVDEFVVKVNNILSIIFGRHGRRIIRNEEDPTSCAV